LVEFGEPTIIILIRIAGARLVRPGQRCEAALDDAEPGPRLFGLECHDDEGRVRLAELALACLPAERKEPRRVARLDASLVRAVPAPGEEQPAAGTQVDLGFVAEPPSQVLRLGHDPPNDLRGSVDDDFPLDRVRDHGGERYQRCATFGCAGLAACATIGCVTIPGSGDTVTTSASKKL